MRLKDAATPVPEELSGRASKTSLVSVVPVMSPVREMPPHAEEVAFLLLRGKEIWPMKECETEVLLVYAEGRAMPKVNWPSRTETCWNLIPVAGSVYALVCGVEVRGLREEVTGAPWAHW